MVLDSLIRLLPQGARLSVLGIGNDASARLHACGVHTRFGQGGLNESARQALAEAEQMVLAREIQFPGILQIAQQRFQGSEFLSQIAFETPISLWADQLVRERFMANVHVAN